MTPNFDKFFKRVINEFLTAKSRRKESRYWKPNLYPKSSVRKVRNLNNKSASQRTKLGNQQYIGNYWGDKGIRNKNTSEKGSAEAGIAKGLGNHLRVVGTNPKKLGAKINSKQGNMVIKNTMPNGMVTVGSAMKKGYVRTQRNFAKNIKESVELIHEADSWISGFIFPDNKVVFTKTSREHHVDLLMKYKGDFMYYLDLPTDGDFQRVVDSMGDFSSISQAPLIFRQNKVIPFAIAAFDSDSGQPKLYYDERAIMDAQKTKLEQITNSLIRDYGKGQGF